MVDNEETKENNVFDLTKELDILCTVKEDESNLVDSNEIEDIQSFISSNKPSQEEEAIEKIEKIKTKRELKPTELMKVIQRFELDPTEADIIRKMEYSFVNNIEFYDKIKKILKIYDVKSKVMGHFEIRKSYTGYHDWIDGKRLDLPSVGMDSLAKKMGYDLKLVPVKIKNPIEKDPKIIEQCKIDEDIILKLQNDFIEEIHSEVKEKLIPLAKKKKTKKKNIPKAMDMIGFLSDGPEESILDNFMGSMKVPDNIDETSSDNFTDPTNMVFIDTEANIIEQTVVLDDKIDNEMVNGFDINEEINRPKPFEQMDNSLSEDVGNFNNIQHMDIGNIIIPNNVGGVELDDDYDDSIDMANFGPPKTEIIKDITNTKFKGK